MVGFGGDLDEDVVVEGLDGGGDADDVLEVLVPAVVEVARGVGGGVPVEQVVVGVEVGDVLAHGGLRHLVRVGFLRRDLLRLHVLLELAWHEVHEDDAVAGRTRGGRVRFGLPRVEVRVVHHHEVDSLRQRFLERRQVAAMVFAEHGYVEHVAPVAHEVFVG